MRATSRAAVKVLEGRNDEVNAELARAMEQAAEALQYERAAALRDQLAALKQVQAQQIVTAEGDRDIDVFALVGEPGEFAISVMIIRGGRNLGSTCYFPKGVARRAQRSAGLVPHAVLRRDAAARRKSSSTSSWPRPKRWSRRSANARGTTLATCGGRRARCRRAGWR